MALLLLVGAGRGLAVSGPIDDLNTSLPETTREDPFDKLESPVGDRVDDLERQVDRLTDRVEDLETEGAR